MGKSRAVSGGALRARLLANMRKPAVLAPAVLGVSLAGASQAQVYSGNYFSNMALLDPTVPATITGSINVISGTALITSGTLSGWQISNLGTINSSDTSINGIGVDIRTEGTLTNAGFIHSDGEDSVVMLRAGGLVVNDVGGNIEGMNNGVHVMGGAASTIVNHGTISGGGAGILLDSGTNNTVQNDGTISTGAIGIKVGTGVSMNLTNTGLISANVTPVDMSEANGGTVVNSGTLAVGGAGINAVVFGSAGGTLKLQTGSTIIGGLEGGAHGALVLEGTNSMSNTVTGFSTLTMLGTDWTLAGNTAAANTEIVSGVLRVTGMLNSAVQVDSGAVLAGTGAVSQDVFVQNGGTVSPGSVATPGTLTVVGNYIQGPNGTLAIRVTPSTASRLSVGGVATLGGVLAVNSATGDYSAEPTFTVLNATGLTGTFNQVLASDASLTPTVTYDVLQSRVLLTLAPALGWTPGDNNVSLSGDITTPQNGDTGNDILNLAGAATVKADMSNIETLNIGSVASTASEVSMDSGTQQFGNTVIHPNATLILNGSQFGSDTLTLAGGTLATNVDYAYANPITVTANSLLTTAGGHTMTLGGSIGGAGGLSTGGAGMLILNGANTYAGGTSVLGGTLEVGDENHPGASVAGDVLVASGAMLRGHGTIGGDVANNDGTVRPGGSIGTLTIAGNYSQSPNGTLMVDISPTTASLLKVGGTASLAGRLALVYGPGTYQATTYRLVQANSVVGQFSSVTSNNGPAGFNQTLNTQSNAVDLALTAIPSDPQNPSNPQNPTDPTQPSQPSQPGAPDGGGTVIVRPYNASIFGALGSSAVRDGQRVTDTLLNRLAQSCAQPGGADCVRPGYKSWVQLTSDTTHQHGADGANGNTDKRYGFLAGVDHQVGEWTLGVAGGYSHADISEKDPDSTGKIDTLRAAFYGSRPVGAVTLAGMVGGAYDFISSKRDFGALGTVKGDTDGQEAQAGLQASLPLRAGPMVFTPRLGLRYQYFHGGSFNESGVDSQNLSVHDQDLHSLQPYAGVTADYAFGGFGDKPSYIQGRVAYAYETLDNDRGVSVTSADGTGFVVPGAAPTRGMLTAGVSVGMRVGKQFDVALSYDTLFRTGNTSAQSFMLSANYRF